MNTFSIGITDQLPKKWIFTSFFTEQGILRKRIRKGKQTKNIFRIQLDSNMERSLSKCDRYFRHRKRQTKEELAEHFEAGQWTAAAFWGRSLAVARAPRLSGKIICTASSTKARRIRESRGSPEEVVFTSWRVFIILPWFHVDIHGECQGQINHGATLSRSINDFRACNNWHFLKNDLRQKT